MKVLSVQAPAFTSLSMEGSSSPKLSFPPSSPRLQSSSPGSAAAPNQVSPNADNAGPEEETEIVQQRNEEAGESLDEGEAPEVDGEGGVEGEEEVEEEAEEEEEEEQQQQQQQQQQEQEQQNGEEETYAEEEEAEEGEPITIDLLCPPPVIVELDSSAAFLNWGPPYYAPNSDMEEEEPQDLQIHRFEVDWVRVQCSGGLSCFVVPDHNDAPSRLPVESTG